MKKYEELEVRVVSLIGDAYDIGLQQSKEIQESAHLAQEELLLALSTNCNAQKAQEELQVVLPNHLQEIKGLASGLDLPYESIIKMYSGYNMTFPEMGCTSFAHDEFYVRNYDFSPSLYDARLIFSNPSEGYASVGFSQQIIGRLDGMNENGLVVGLHFVNNQWEGEGFLASTIVRILLEKCKNIEEAISQLKKIPHRYCYNYSMTDTSGKMVVVEATPTEQIVCAEQLFSCTNHFESQKLKEKNKAYIENSIQRKHDINRFIANACPTALSAFYHFNDGNSPLFFKQYKQYFGTLHTVVYSPNQLEVIVGIGENSEPHTFSLHQFIRGNLLLPTTIKGKILLAI